eukprot:139760_1
MNMRLESVHTIDLEYLVYYIADSPTLDLLCRHYFPATDGIIFIVDSNDRKRICNSYCHPDKITTLTFGYITEYLKEIRSDVTHKIPLSLYHMISQYAQNEDWCDATAQSELHKLLKEPNLESVPLLVFANKMDLPNALEVDQVTDCLELNKIPQKDRIWHIQPSCATTEDGLYEGLEWLIETMKNKKKRK